MTSNNGRKICYRRGRDNRVICKKKGIMCPIARKNVIENGRFIGKLSNSLAPLKFPLLVPLSPAIDLSIDRLADLGNRYRMKNC